MCLVKSLPWNSAGLGVGLPILWITPQNLWWGL